MVCLFLAAVWYSLVCIEPKGFVTISLLASRASYCMLLISLSAFIVNGQVRFPSGVLQS